MTSYPSSFQDSRAFSGGCGVESVIKILGGPLLKLRKPPVPGAEDATDILAMERCCPLKVSSSGVVKGCVQMCAVHARALGAGAVLCQPMLVDLVVILAPILVAMKFNWFGFSQ